MLIFMNLDDLMIEAAKEGDIKTVREALKLGADVHADDDSALVEAAKNGHMNVVKLLLKYGADVDVLEKSLMGKKYQFKGE